VCVGECTNAPQVFPNLVEHLLTWFGAGPTIELWAAAMTEHKVRLFPSSSWRKLTKCNWQILIHSANRSVLSLIAESLVALMYPFRWESGYVPILPRLVGVINRLYGLTEERE